ncbi:unnamed protein product [Diatraea saccharalis]|uniref:Laminin G domain-containing protein n=1 Tax=Diatraea saccharalis TaxID=40085 RepID=A0A9N9QWG7_9NEOP|nr:unnamed protein product [Diatraea saccharalis]
MIRDGKLKLVVRGRKRRELALDAFVADGTWRSSARAPGPPPRAHRLYVGGAPPPPAARMLPPAISRVGGFVGCVRRVSVNNRAEDLVRDARDHHAVGQCFPDVEQAAYFAGDAYAAVNGVEESAEVRIKFRSSAPRGILLAAEGLLLELRDGKVVLTRYSEGSETGRAESWGAGGEEGAGGAGARAVCDGRWHVAGVRGAALSVDRLPPARLTPALLHDAAPAPPRLLYVAGAPEGTADLPDGGRENFKGCIAEVWVGGRAVSWSEMKTHNVLLDSCPKR